MWRYAVLISLYHILTRLRRRDSSAAFGWRRWSLIFASDTRDFQNRIQFKVKNLIFLKIVLDSVTLLRYSSRRLEDCL